MNHHPTKVIMIDALRDNIAKLMVLLAICLSLLLFYSSKSMAQPAEPVLEGEVKLQVESLQSEASSILAEIEQLDQQLEVIVEEHNRTRVLVDQLSFELADSRNRLDYAHTELAAQQELINQRLTAVYKADDINVFSLLLRSDSLDGFFNQVRYMQKISEQDIKLEQRLRDTTEEIDELTIEIDNKRAEQMDLEKDLGEQEYYIESVIADRQQKYNQLDVEVQRILTEEADRQQAEMERIAAESQAMLDDLGITDAVQAQVVQTALQYLGVPYVWGGESPSGFDCSGLVKYVYAQHGVQLPHNAAMQFGLGVPVPRDQLQPGDLIFWGPGNPHHVAMYIGNGKYIEAPTFNEVVSIDTLVFDGDYAGARRFPLKARS